MLDPGEIGQCRALVVREVGGPNQTGCVSELGKAVKHQDAAAQAVGTNLEAGAIRRTRIDAPRPRPGRIVIGSRCGPVVLAVVIDDLEQPCRWIGGSRLAGGERRAVAVLDPLEVALGSREEAGCGSGYLLEAADLAHLRGIDTRPVLGLVGVADGVAAVVSRLLQEPGEYASGCRRIGDPGARGPAVEAGHVVACDDAEVDVPGGLGGPALDPGERSLDAGAIALDAVSIARHRGCPDRHQIFGAGQHEDIRVLGVDVLRQPLVGLARDRRDRLVPADAERSIAGA